MSDTCDLAYAVLVERVTAQVIADRQTVGLATVLSGVRDVMMPTIADAVQTLDEWLVSEPTRLDQVESKYAILTEALGLRRAG